MVIYWHSNVHTAKAARLSCLLMILNCILWKIHVARPVKWTTGRPVRETMVKILVSTPPKTDASDLYSSTYTGAALTK